METFVTTVHGISHHCCKKQCDSKRLNFSVVLYSRATALMFAQINVF